MMTNKDLIRMHLEKYIYETCTASHYVPGWDELIAYCSGYYQGASQETILDIIWVVRELQMEGKVK